MSATHKTFEPPAANEQPHITYKVDKMTFIVEPVYNKGSSKTIHELLINLMVVDVKQTA